MFRSALLVALVSVSTAAAPAAPTPLSAAKTAFDDLDFDKAMVLLDAAAEERGNTRAAVLEILTLQGVVAASLGKTDRARAAFRELLVLSPDAQLPANQPPRVRTPYYEAKEWASSKGLLPVATVTVSDQLVRALKVTIPVDELRLAKAVVFRVEGAAPRTVEMLAGQAKLEVNAASVKWSASVLGVNERSLFEVPSREDAAPRAEPVVAAAPAPTAKKEELVPPPPPMISAEPPAPSVGWMRPVGIGVGAAGVVAFAVGVGFGASVSGAQAKLNNASRDANGVITGLTQAEAAQLDASARANAPVANGLMIGGGLAAAGGVLLFLLGAPVVATPTSNGVAVTGKF